jgi:nucleotide-binding universal stress UspA family protein
MKMHFLLATDISPASARMLRYVFELNRHFFAKLELLHVFDLPVAAVEEEGIWLKDHDAVVSSIEQNLWTFMEENRGAYHFDTNVSVVSGGVFRAVADRAKKWPADLIITGHLPGNKSTVWSSSGTGRHLLTHPPVPVLCVPEQAVLPPRIKQILICTDLSELPDQRGLQFLTGFAGALKANLSVLHVTVSNEIAGEEDEKIKIGWRQALGVSMIILEHPGHLSLSALISNYAAAHNIDLLVVFPHKHTWLDQWMLGSESGKLFDKIDLPILSMPMRWDVSRNEA